ncbi:hypothetical protein PanWU01x14_061660 [Parasponia andersonii]|uniref:Uncharacterized protein n=1 Tax=Parasponia andersonii TaxID=3476 RepID=A0A2P5DI95_PARAD|nr:hypothetical protein PanWU01x14_061660 [Parasponia andersonii]
MSWRPRVVRNQSWGRDESNNGSGTVIGRRTAARQAKNQSGVANFQLRFLLRQAAVHGSSTRRWFVGVFWSLRMDASGTAVDGGGSGEQFPWVALGGFP